MINGQELPDSDLVYIIKLSNTLHTNYIQVIPYETGMKINRMKITTG